MKRRARCSGRSRDRARLEDVRARYGLPRAVHALCRHDRAAKEPAAPDDGVCRRAQGRHSAPAGLRRPVRMVVARPRRAHRAAGHSATSCTSPATCRSRTCRRSTTSASFFVFPSLYEGFGLPVVEAMACGIAGDDVEHLVARRDRGRRRRDRSIRRTPTRWPTRSSGWRRDAELRRDRAERGLAARAQLLVGADRARHAGRLSPRRRRDGASRRRRARRQPPNRRVPVKSMSTEPAVVTTARAGLRSARARLRRARRRRSVSAAAPADASAAVALDSIRIPRARDRLRHRRRHGVPRRARRPRRRLRSVGRDVEPHQAAAGGGRPRRSRRHPVVRPAGSAAVSRRARSCRRLRCDRLEFRRAQLRAVARRRSASSAAVTCAPAARWRSA